MNLGRFVVAALVALSPAVRGGDAPAAAASAGGANSATTERPAKRAAVRQLAGGAQARSQLWFSGSLDLGNAGVSYSSSASGGFGLGAGVGYSYHFAEAWGAQVGVGYQRLALGRAIDGTGQLEDSHPAEISQVMGYFTAEVLGLVRILPEGASSAVWLEAGGQALLPMSGTQTLNGGTPTAIASPDRLWLATLGVRSALALGDGWVLQGRGQAFYNVAATGGSRYWGLRLGVAVGVAL